MSAITKNYKVVSLQKADSDGSARTIVFAVEAKVKDICSSSYILAWQIQSSFIR